ncbi:hypothetical protein HDA40_004164 [Hamadaea flava]|uniref:Uncharacterized protein n=1 Tax=Hamadaea flava TaxID=1742688 RepID=A0ABV8LHV3_9ACTN|nr:hypothetical protein [Hamadaea flava]MCP2325657.1 hypothetical protein [Hamadaea flava]
MLASLAASVRITVPKSAVLCPCVCGALAVMSTAKRRCIRCGGTATGPKATRNAGRN